VELRSPDSLSNPYLDFALIIYASLYGLDHRLPLPEPADFNSFAAGAEKMKQYRKLPASLTEAASYAWESRFIRDFIPELILRGYYNR
jgi:glutamine synthetase